MSSSSSDTKQNDVLRKMNTLLAALNQHIDDHPSCCLKNVLKLFEDNGNK